MDETHSSCGQELAGDADVPRRLGALIAHVAANLETHAHWVGTESAEARQEHRALTAIAEQYRLIARAFEQAATTMTSLASLPPAPHDPLRFDRRGFVEWMQKKVELQLDCATLLREHAERSQQILAELERSPR